MATISVKIDSEFGLGSIYILKKAIFETPNSGINLVKKVLSLPIIILFPVFYLMFLLFFIFDLINSKFFSLDNGDGLLYEIASRPKQKSLALLPISIILYIIIASLHLSILIIRVAFTNWLGLISVFILKILVVVLVITFGSSLEED
jgi:hypothetical protein